MKYILSQILFLVGFVCIAQDADYSPLTVPKQLKENADSVLRNELITLDVSDPRYLIWKNYRVITVLNKKGNSDVDAYVYYDDNTNVSDISATVYDLLGQEQEKFKKRDFKDVSAVSGGTLFADSRVLHLDYTPTSYPYTIVFESEVKSETTAFIPGWLPIGDYGSSTQYSKYEIIYDPADKLAVKEVNFGDYDIEKTEKPGHVAWTAQNIPAVNREYLSPAFTDHMPYVKCALNNFYLEGVPGVADSWQSFGSWMTNNLLQECNDLPQETVTAVRAMVANETTDLAKAKKIYQFVQDKVRYISVQVGIGGWKPMKASEVDRLGYGDCKALTNYTKNLLQAVDIPSYYTVLYAGEEKRSLDPDLVAVQGNHAILAVDLAEKEDLVWLECTSQVTPFGYLGDFTDDREVLMMTDEGGVMAKTTKYDGVSNNHNTHVSLDLANNGNVTGQLSMTSHGIFYGDKMYMKSQSEKEIKENYLDQWSQVSSLELSEIELDNDKENVAFEEDMNFTIKNYADLVNDEILLKANAFSGSSKNIPPRYKDRLTNFILMRGSISEDTFEYKLPEGYTAAALPEALDEENEFGSYHAEVKLDDAGKLVYYRKEIVNEGEYGPELYKKYRDYCKQIARYDNLKLLIRKKS